MAVLQTGRLLQGFSQASQRQLTTAISEDVLDGKQCSWIHVQAETYASPGHHPGHS